MQICTMEPSLVCHIRSLCISKCCRSFYRHNIFPVILCFTPSNVVGGIVSNTLRPPVPEPCDPDWRALMERCWSSEPSERPNFTEIADELRAMANKLPPKGQLQQQLPSTNPQVKS